MYWWSTAYGHEITMYMHVLASCYHHMVWKLEGVFTNLCWSVGINFKKRKHSIKHQSKENKTFLMTYTRFGRMGHSRKHPYHPPRGNRKLTPYPLSDVLIHLLLSETIFSPLPLRTAEISSVGGVWIFSGTTQWYI
jgi:hypothetical protein